MLPKPKWKNRALACAAFVFVCTGEPYFSYAVASPPVEMRDYYIPANLNNPNDAMLCITPSTLQEGPVLTCQGRDRLVVAWVTEPVAPLDARVSIYFRVIYLDNPPHWTRPRRLHDPDYHDPETNIEVHHVHPSIAMNATDGSWIAVWERRIIDQTPGQQIQVSVAVVGRRFNANGDPVSEVFLIDEAPTAADAPGPKANPVVGINDAGDQCVVWQPLDLPDQNEPQYAELKESRLTGIIYRWDGSLLIRRFQVAKPLDTGCEPATPDLIRPSVSMDSLGHFSVSWDSGPCRFAFPDGLRAFKLIRSGSARLIKSSQARHDLWNTSMLFRMSDGHHGEGVFVGEPAPMPQARVKIRSLPFTVEFPPGLQFDDVTPIQPDPLLSGEISLSECYRLPPGRQEFPSIFTQPSGGLVACADLIAWTHPRPDCTDPFVCHSDADVFARLLGGAASCGCETSDFNVNAVTAERDDDQETGPPNLTAFEDYPRGDRRQVIGVTMARLSSAPPHVFGPVRAYAWQSTDLDNPPNDFDPKGVFITLVAADGTSLPDFQNELTPAPPADCNTNGPTCVGRDRNHNGILDECEIDCNTNGTADICEAASTNDCNGDGWLNVCDSDCNTNGTPDGCDVSDESPNRQPDCNTNGLPDICDMTSANCSRDCDTNGTPDECQRDCNSNGTLDDCEPIQDCNSNGVPDTCDVGVGNYTDCDGDGMIDQCEPIVDCNTNGVFDACEAVNGSAPDCNTNFALDFCEILDPGKDCNSNGTLDACEYFAFDKGDMNLDGSIDGRDIQLFVNTIILQPNVSALHFYLADVAAPFCILNVADRDYFVCLLLGLTCGGTPSPPPGPGAPGGGGEGGEGGSAPATPPPAAPANPQRAAAYAALRAWRAEHPPSAHPELSRRQYVHMHMSYRAQLGLVTCDYVAAVDCYYAWEEQNPRSAYPGLTYTQYSHMAIDRLVECGVFRARP